MNRLDLTDTRERLLGRCLLRQAQAQPDADFIVWDQEHYSFGRVNELANASARAFAELGVKPGDTVSFMMGTCPDWIWLTLGLNKLGAIWVPTNVDYKGQWLRESFEDSGARLLVADVERFGRIAELGALPFERIVARGDLAADHADVGVPLVPISELTQAPAGGEVEQADLSYGDTSSILWTSGTTGRSKGVEQSHNVWIRAAITGGENAGIKEGEVLYNCLPMYQSAAWVANVYRALVFGVPCAMDPAFSPREFWNRTRHYGATMIFTLGAMHMFLWNAPERDDDRDNPVRVAGAIPMPEDLIPRFQERFGIEEVHQGYGQSECMALLARRPGQSYKPNSLGGPVDGIEVKLLDDEDTEVPTGDVGEICVRPREPYAIFNGYWRNPEATVAAWSNLWYHTGDLSRRDEDGEYYFVDRKADFIRFKGRNISSFAVEASVSAHPAVAQCAVHGVTSAELEAEAELKACVVLKPGEAATAEDLARFVNDNAPYFFVPRYIEFMESLPSTPTGRVQKYQLRERGVTDATWDGQAVGFKIER
jgi:crotonobetaine/carnitine-CoA ligase